MSSKCIKTYIYIMYLLVIWYERLRCPDALIPDVVANGTSRYRASNVHAVLARTGKAGRQVR